MRWRKEAAAKYFFVAECRLLSFRSKSQVVSCLQQSQLSLQLGVQRWYSICADRFSACLSLSARLKAEGVVIISLGEKGTLDRWWCSLVGLRWRSEELDIIKSSSAYRRVNTHIQYKRSQNMILTLQHKRVLRSDRTRTNACCRRRDSSRIAHVIS